MASINSSSLKLKIIHTKEFTTDALKTTFENLLNSCLRSEEYHCYRKPELKWLALIDEEGNMVSGLVYRVYKKQKLVYLKSLATSVDHRCKGYASYLISYFQRNVVQSKEVYLFCDRERVAFYKRRGAKTTGKKKFNKRLPTRYRIPESCVCMKFEKAALPTKPAAGG
jgi:N-acetylglutamate synthase-like GNAT family acetyltransferase